MRDLEAYSLGDDRDDLVPRKFQRMPANELPPGLGDPLQTAPPAPSGVRWPRGPSWYRGLPTLSAPGLWNGPDSRRPYITGAGLANSVFGLPDVGLVTRTELVRHVGRIREACRLRSSSTPTPGSATLYR